MRLLNPIPQTNLDPFNLTFFDAHSLQIDNLINIFQISNSLNHNQWQEACQAFEEITNNITEIIHKTSLAPHSLNLLLQPTDLVVTFHANYKNNRSNILKFTTLHEK
jgi:hypothetical protein